MSVITAPAESRRRGSPARPSSRLVANTGAASPVQAERLVESGVPELGGATAAQLREHAASLDAARPDSADPRTDDVHVPDVPLYLVGDVRRDDNMLDWTPAEAHAELARRARTPLTISEGVSWLLQEPDRREPGRCFMCIGSRKRKTNGALDARTPALWISGGTGRDGRENKGAPKVGWYWVNNHHTWPGFASASVRLGPSRVGLTGL
jgi:hypothetical protein